MKKERIISGKEIYDSIDKDVDYDDEDLAILEDIRNTDEFVVKNDKKYLDKYIKMAKNTLENKKLISIRLSRHDLNKVKEKAQAEGIPYQTFLSAIIHKVANGKVELSVKI